MHIAMDPSHRCIRNLELYLEPSLCVYWRIMPSLHSRNSLRKMESSHLGIRRGTVRFQRLSSVVSAQDISTFATTTLLSDPNPGL